MASDMASLWRRLERWARAEAPEMLRDLRGPAGGAALDRLERKVGRALPADLRSSLLVHDGEKDRDYSRFFREYGRLLSASEIAEYWSPDDEEADRDEVETRIAEEIISVEGGVRPVTSRRGWIPFMDLNGDVTWYVDLDPASGGNPGQVIEVHLEACSWAVKAPSFQAFLLGYLEALEAGEYDARDDEGLPVRASDQDELRAAMDRPLVKAALRSATVDQLEELPAGASAECLAVVLGSRGNRHKLKIGAKRIEASGDLSGTDSLALSMEIQVGKRGSKPRYTILRWWEP